ncbi:MAG TPA: methylated-DNA--[protein]-cysteine S-methyltransferase [Polyangiales bacterium]
MRLRVEHHASPIGTLALVTNAAGELCALDYPEYEARLLRLLSRHHGGSELVQAPPTPALSRALDAYFGGALQALDGLVTATHGSPFQRTVWSALRAIPPGTTVSYGQLAAQLGQPNAARAVGLANGSNPIAIVVPCHRVIGANGALTGYAGGVERKRWLLAHERSASSHQAHVLH